MVLPSAVSGTFKLLFFVMDRHLLSCAHDLSSWNSTSSSDGGNRVCSGGVPGIRGFRVLDVQSLRDGGDGTDLEPGTKNLTFHFVN